VRSCSSSGAITASCQRSPANARIDSTVTRGLLLDLLATRDRAAVDAAMERCIAALAPAHETPS
jgi:hypothetical protein